MRTLAYIVLLILALVSMVGVTGCRNRANAPTSGGGTLSFEFFDAKANVNSGCYCMQNAVCDNTHHKVYFFPWGINLVTPFGTLLEYDTTHGFKESSSWAAYDIPAITGNAHLKGPGAGCIGGDYLYFAPLYDKTSGTIGANTYAFRANLADAHGLGDSGSWETFDLSTLNPPPSHYGWGPAVYCNGYVYYSPLICAGGHTGHTDSTRIEHGMFLRYNVSGAFNNATSWEYIDLAALLNNSYVKGYQTIAAIGTSVYLIPFTHDYAAKYDTTKSFDSAGSYTVIDWTRIDSNAQGYTGFVVNGTDLIVTPWRIPGKSTSCSLALKYDSTAPFDNVNSYQVFDLANINSSAKGYQCAWVTNDGYCYFAPCWNFSITKPPPIAIWDTSKSFTAASSWQTVEIPGINSSYLFAGCASDGTYGYLVPYGVQPYAYGGTVVRVSKG